MTIALKQGAEKTPIKGHVEVCDVTIRLGGGASAKSAVEDFSMQVYPGELVCLVGPSGCGKSSVLNVIGGFLRPSRGKVIVDGQIVTGRPAASRGVVFQQYALFPWLTASENVSFGARMRGVGPIQRAKIAAKYLSLVGLREEGDRFPDELSGGMQQRVGIARVLANSPDVMLMDEPFGALDAQTRLSMQHLLLNVWARNRTTIIFVTHDLDEALLLADRIFLMGNKNPGKLIEIITLPFPRPRRISELVARSDYGAIKADLVRKLHLDFGPAKDEDVN